MSTLQRLTEETIRTQVIQAVSDVFQIMLKAKIVAIPDAPGAPKGAIPPDLAQRLAAPHVVGSVAFIGEINGTVCFYFPQELARSVTEKLLGLDEVDDSTISDAIGEVTNMTVGSFKNALCDAGHPCMLAIPTIIKGSGISVETTVHTERHLYHFQYAGHRVLAAVLIKTDD